MSPWGAPGGVPKVTSVTGCTTDAMVSEGVPDSPAAARVSEGGSGHPIGVGVSAVTPVSVSCTGFGVAPAHIVSASTSSVTAWYVWLEGREDKRAQFLREICHGSGKGKKDLL